MHEFPRRNAAFRLVTLALVLGFSARGAHPQEDEGLSTLNLEQLAEIEVTSVSRWPQRLAAVANAVFVITQEDIRRSGATTLVDLLRLVPGVHVAQIDSNKWAVGVRGFTGRLARSTLVLIDGRSVYNPLFAGTYWEVQDVVLADIDRIEVIRGPGGTLWGANAVNGVINILTKPASATQGWLAHARAGTWERSVSLRYGGQPGEHAWWRAYAKGFRRDAARPAMPPPYDAWDGGQIGFRTDFARGARNQVTVQGDGYSGDYGSRVFVPRFDPPSSVPVDGDSRASGGNLLARLIRQQGRSQTTVQAWIDRTRRLDLTLGEWRTTADLEAQHHVRGLPLGQELIAGVGYRLTRDRTVGSQQIFLERPSRSAALYSAFVQDELSLVDDRVHLSGGLKVEHNAFTGLEWQPSVRASWAPHGRRLLWGAVSRAIRSPSRIELDLAGTGLVAASPPTFLRLTGNEQFQSERLIAYELGWRDQAQARLHWDLSLFRNVYDRLLSVEPGAPFLEVDPAPPHLILPVVLGNGLEGTGQGAELTASWQAGPRWHLHAAWSYLNLDLKTSPGSADSSSVSQEDNSPRHQGILRSSFDFPRAMEFNAQLRWIDRLPAQQVDAYAELDAELGWSPRAGLRVALVGRNLLHARHAEFTPPPTRVELERSVYGSVMWTW